ncbi:superfamily II DNA or RNA helicase [Natranaerovirga hydrolytica]|uniref:Superfamily II DNA or RNA helicase n=1 Tax=Natranaerovirga hydrolytica TaxID=680378 RepID=A0A4R1M9Q6_9FIRM|nr:DEAD/DEAH box helicase family protein [Natranaerovirga hydrolytica]TCK89118.1 superfamily II DNA or RNA helicase [Natranaerovirga hydrolytica]
MSLREVEIKQSYRTSIDNIPTDFYIPLLSRAILYKRAVGFFSSTILSKISTGISDLANKGGTIQIVASPKLSEDDIEAIRKGYQMRDIVLRNAIIREMTEPQTLFEEKRLNQLANLIADGILDIKIAFTENNNNIGMYHEKMGLISDNEGNTLAFSGSMNESLTAVSLNYESIDVFCSWKSDEQRERVQDKQAAFSAIWNNNEPNIMVLEFPELTEEIIQRYKREKVEQYEDFDDEAENEMPEILPLRRTGAIIPADVTLHSYQIEAIDEWERNGFRGIFDMATGTGKTYTGLGALARLCATVNNKLAAIIVCPYQHLVEQWVEDIERFSIKPIIGYSASSQRNWLKRLEIAIRDQKLKIKGREFFCFVCTNATFASVKVQELLGKVHSDVLLLVDEAHNFGAERLSKMMSERYRYRLALSATIERHNDEDGTNRLYDYFGKKCIEYPLERAIDEKKLTRYKYHPIITTLNKGEMAVYIDLTLQMSKCLVKGKDGKYRLNERGKKLALKRARLVAGIEDKLTKLEKYIQPYLNDNHLLIYCGATTLLQDNQDRTDTTEDDLRQIDAVTDLLGNKLNMKVSQFTSKEDIEEREILKREFAAGETLQALIAIKCLDEGVNIPAIRTAFILASTTNPKEYIQRRGRVLRLYKEKDYAEIYDFLALPRPLDEVASLTDEELRRELSLVQNELARAIEFAQIAMNMGEAEQVIDEIKAAYSINDYKLEFEEDYSYVE